MGSIGKDDKEIHFRTQGDTGSSLTVGSIEVQYSLLICGHFAEEIDAGDHIAKAKSMLVEFYEEVVVRIAKPIVFVILIGGFTKGLLDDFRRGIAGQRIVPSKRVLHDRDHGMAHVTHQDMTFCDFGGVKCLECVWDIETVEWVICVEEERGDIGLRGECCQADVPVTGHPHRPHGSTWNLLGKNGGHLLRG